MKNCHLLGLYKIKTDICAFIQSYKCLDFYIDNLKIVCYNVITARETEPNGEGVKENV